MCGIFGIINTRKTDFDKTVFNTLGVINDTRGGDSCGVFIDKEYEYGVDKEKLYYYFIDKSKLLKKTNKARIALGHCRKASVGGINEATAQPVVIKNNNGDIIFVLIHNGTIYNYEELAKKYLPNMNITGMTDSQVMAYIFCYKGFGALKEYIGAGAFVAVDYRYKEPRVNIFKGASKKYSTDKDISDERPLYYTYNDKELIFSSIYEPLKGLRSDQSVYSFSANCLLRIEHSKVLFEKKYDRSEMTQNKPIPAYTGYGSYTYGDDYWSKDYYKDQNNRGYIDTVEFSCLYKFRGKPCHGEYKCSKYGSVGFATSDFSLYFWRGTLLKSKNCFEFLENYCEDFGCTEDDLAELCPDLVNLFSPYPYLDNGVLYKAVNIDVSIPYTGDINPLFQSRIYDIVDGIKKDGPMRFGATTDMFNKLVAMKDFIVELKDLEGCKEY